MNNELAVVKYDVTDAALSELKAKYTGLKIVDTASYENVRVALADVRGKRTGVEEARLAFGRKVLGVKKQADDRAKEITTALLEIETPLKTEKDLVDNEKARIKAEKDKKELDRVAAIRARIFAMQQLVSNFLGKTAPELQAISEKLFDTEIVQTVYQEFTDEAERVKMECLDISLKAREVRIKWEQEEAARKVEAERLEKQRKEQEAEAKRLAEEKAKLEADKKADQARKDRERITEEARIKAEQEAQEKFARVEREKKEREEAEEKEKARREALMPAVQRLHDFALALENLKCPVFAPSESKKAKNIITEVRIKLSEIANYIRKEADKL